MRKKVNSDMETNPNMNENDLQVMVDTCASEEPLRIVESIDTPNGPHTGVVLATLDGPVMDYIHDTRNDRLYEEDLCDSIYSSDYVAELIATNNFLGEPDHPMRNENRLDVHYPYVSHAIRNFRKVPEKGCYYATFDILDTPQGRILKTLIDYGVNLGVSSRGSGRTITKNGRIVVDKRTYRFITFDIVHMPGNKVARLPQANESIAIESAQTLTEQIDDLIASKDLEQLRSVLPVLNFLSESQDMQDLIGKVETSIESINESNTIAEPDTTDLLEAYATIKSLKSDISSKDSMIESLNARIQDLQQSNESLQNTNSELNEKLSKSVDLVRTHVSREQESRRKLSLVESKLSEALDANSQLTESLESANSSSDEKDSKISKLNESLQEMSSNATRENEILRRKLDMQDSDMQSMTEQLHYTEDKCNEAVSKYFSLRCKQLGLNESVVLKSLGDDLSRYSIEEIDSQLHESFLAKPKASRATPILESMNQTARVSTLSKSDEPTKSVNPITDICRSVRNA